MKTASPKTTRPMPIDPVIAEVRRAKVELLERFNYDLAAMAQDARDRQSKSGHRVVTKAIRTGEKVI